jgi:hypothetical protein
VHQLQVAGGLVHDDEIGLDRREMGNLGAQRPARGERQKQPGQTQRDPGPHRRLPENAFDSRHGS